MNFKINSLFAASIFLSSLPVLAEQALSLPEGTHLATERKTYRGEHVPTGMAFESFARLVDSLANAEGVARSDSLVRSILNLDSSPPDGASVRELRERFQEASMALDLEKLELQRDGLCSVVGGSSDEIYTEMDLLDDQMEVVSQRHFEDFMSTLDQDMRGRVISAMADVKAGMSVVYLDHKGAWERVTGDIGGEVRKICDQLNDQVTAARDR